MKRLVSLTALSVALSAAPAMADAPTPQQAAKDFVTKAEAEYPTI